MTPQVKVYTSIYIYIARQECSKNEKRDDERREGNYKIIKNVSFYFYHIMLIKMLQSLQQQTTSIIIS